MSAQLDGKPLTSYTTEELVAHAAAAPWIFKDVSAELEKRPPDAPAAHHLIAAFQSGQAPAWLVAVLLGRVGHEVGYATAREILLSAPGSFAENYAGAALARIRREGALEDLCAL